MPERDYSNNWDDWLNDTGGDTGYGGTNPTEGDQSGYQEDPDAWMFDPNRQPLQAAPSGWEWRFGEVTPGGRPHWHHSFVPGSPQDSIGVAGGNITSGTGGGGGGTTFGGGGSSGGGGGYSFTGGSFSGWPSYSSPGYIDPGPFDPGPAFNFPSFAFRDFEAPDPNNMLSDKGFEFRIGQGRKALEASAAGRGKLRSGGTLKDILEYGQNFASQEYGNVYNRALQEYDTNRNNAFGNWNANRGNALDTWQAQYGQRRDVYDRHAGNVGHQNTFNQNNSQFDFNGRQRQAEAEFNDAFNRWKAQGDWLSQSWD